MVMHIVYIYISSPLVQWLALWFCDLHIAGLNQAGDGQVYVLLKEIALDYRRYLFFNDDKHMYGENVITAINRNFKL